jgi:hypothetical protein
MTDKHDSDSRRRIEQQVAAELARLGLTWADMPGGGFMISGDVEGFVSHLKTFQPGATWHDILPDIPSQREPGRPGPYRPLGPYDYQELPTGPAVLVAWRKSGPQSVDELLRQSRSAGWPVYGAGMAFRPPRPDIPSHAFVVLERGTGEAEVHGYEAWLHKHPDFYMAASFIRRGTERYSDT